MTKWSIESGPHTFSPKATDEYLDIAYMIRYDPGDGGIFKFLSRQKNDTTGFTKALAMAERIVAAGSGMTTDELLAKLDAEYAKWCEPKYQGFQFIWMKDIRRLQDDIRRYVKKFETEG